MVLRKAQHDGGLVGQHEIGARQDAGAFAAVNAVWDGWVIAGEEPARTTIEARLTSPDYDVELGIIATRQLAKRQITWLRAMPERIIIDCLAPDATAQLMAELAARTLLS